MKKYLAGFYFSLPIQLLLLHFRRYQVILLFWYVLFATVSGHFLEPYGANSLYLSPEYLASVSAISTAIVGFSVGVFIMSWNITTFILHTKNIRFLATTESPFLKYCVNNGIIPILFLGFYFINAFEYNISQELLTVPEILALSGGFLGGFVLSLLLAFGYFFGADKSIYRRLGNVIISENKRYERIIKRNSPPGEKHEIRVDWFLSAQLGLRKPRNVNHYSKEFLDTIFKRHHFAAVLAILLSLFFLLTIGFFSDNRIFQVPAGASITVFFAILIAVAGAVSLFLGNWSIPVVVVIYLFINFLYQRNIIDPRNKAYGLNYVNVEDRPVYERDSIIHLVSKKNIEADKKVFEAMLENWKKKQKTDTPVLFIVNTSGGGIRSATFTFDVLQKLDSLTGGGFMEKTFLINGASGGMIGATYFRELYWERIKGNPVNLQDNAYSKSISKDLLNPLFSSFVSRDFMGPVRTFDLDGNTYNRDRGYAFEQKLNDNTKGVLDKRLSDYKEAEERADIPIMFFNSTITRDAREMVISTHPARFLMLPYEKAESVFPVNPDAIDFNSFFAKQDPMNLRILSALRMNATFPYVLPNVWLPSTPVIDVMDSGLRDNFGQETSLRFVNNFTGWLKSNTAKVVLVQIRDRQIGDWDRPYESKSIMGFITKPFLLLQSNWYRLQDYFQTDHMNYFSQTLGDHFALISFQYTPSRENASAALSFHLTAAEKKDIEGALNSGSNLESFKQVKELMK